MIALRGLRVLLVEDDPDVADTVATILSERRCIVVAICGSNKSALEAIRERQVDFVLLDLNLTDGQAFPTADDLTAKRIPFAFCTGGSFSSQLSARCGAVARLFKPFRAVRNLRLLDAYRQTGREVVAHWGWAGDETCGMFKFPSPIDGGVLVVIASSGEGWDHVSVSRANRCPNWPEMEHVKRVFFRDNETAMQLHVPPSDHINQHPNCLHLWRPHDEAIPRPPGWMVGTGVMHERSEAETNASTTKG